MGETGEFPGKMLHQAALYNNTDFLRSLLEGDERRNINARDSMGRTALYTCVTNNSYDCAKLLLEAEADTNIRCGRDYNGMTALHIAAVRDKPQFVALLLAHGADWQSCDMSGESPLDLAARNHHEECVVTITQHVVEQEHALATAELGLRQACDKGDGLEAENFAKQLPENLISGVINHVAKGAHSLMYRASETGNLSMLEFLLRHNADAHVHPVTAISPLHAACYNGQVDAAELILQRFPELVQSPTIEGVMPLHIAAETDARLLRMLLEFNYPDEVCQFHQEKQGGHMYRLGLAVNAKDARHRTALHLAAARGHVEAVQTLLDFSVTSQTATRDDVEHGRVRSWTAASLGVRGEEHRSAEDQGSDPGLHPVEVNEVDLEGNTPLHMAVFGDGCDNEGYSQVALILLRHGASANQPVQKGFAEGRTSTPLIEACQRGDVAMADILLRHGAKDPDKKALAAAVLSKDHKLTAVLLKHRAHSDTEFKVNRKAMLDLYCSQHQGRLPAGGTLPRGLFPKVSVAVDWHAHSLSGLQLEYLSAAALHVNGPLRVRMRDTALMAVTRIDISQNCLETLPLEVFQLASLRILNASENQIRAMEPAGGEGGEVPWSAPFLSEVQLQRNCLRAVPAGLFLLPALQKLNLSWNALAELPQEMWVRGSLRELNLSHNRLTGLPADTMQYIESDSPRAASSPTPVPASAAAPRSSVGTDEGDVTEGGLPQPRELRRHKLHLLEVAAGRLRVHTASGEEEAEAERCQLQDLNLSYNLLETAPQGLACLGTALQKLNLSNNRLSQIGHVHLYPAGLKQLDLSYNQIVGDTIFEMPISPVENSLDSSNVRICYSPTKNTRRPSAVSPPVLSSRLGGRGSTPALACPHRCHNALARLKTLRLNNNKLTRLCLLRDHDEEEWGADSGSGSSTPATRRSLSSATSDTGASQLDRSRMLYPGLSLLDLSQNSLTSLPMEISRQDALTEIKLQNNKIKHLPPEMGLLRKLWNLDVRGCPYEKNLMALLGDKAKKTSAIMSYLKSIKDE